MADVATLGIDIYAPNIGKVKTDMDAMSGAAARAEKATEALSRATGGASGAAAAAAKAYGSVGSAAASSSTQLEMMAKAANQNNVAMAASTNSARNLSYQARMVAMQLSQVSQQTQAGTNFWQALAIQLPDLTLGFGAIGIAAGIAGGALLSYYASLTDNSAQAIAALQQQDELIMRVAERWGEAYPAIKAYADQLERAKAAGELQQTQDALVARTFKEVLETLDQLGKSAPSVAKAIRDVTSSDGVLAAQQYLQAMEGIRKSLNAGQDPSKDFTKATSALSVLMSETASPAVMNYADQFEVLASKIRAAVKAAYEYRVQMPDLGTLGEVWAENGQFFNSDQFKVSNPPTPGRRPTRELGYDGMPRGGSTRADPYANALRSTQDRTKVIQAEMAAQAGLNPLIQDYDFALTKAKASADLLNAAEKAKKEITPELNSEIERTATALAEATAAQNRQAEAVQKAKQQMEFVKSTTAGFINDLRNGLREGQSFWEAFGNAALGVLDRITDKLLNDVLDAVFKVSGSASGSSGGSGILGSLFGGLFGGGTNAFPSKPGIGLYAAGTPAARPGLALVGEGDNEFTMEREAA